MERTTRQPAHRSGGALTRMVRFFSMLLVLGSAAPAAADHLFSDWQPPRLLDLSGLVWIGGDSFLAVSDAKNPDELELNRLSLLRLPDSLDGLWFRPISLRYRGGQSSDFESAARVPGTPFALLAESADDDGPFQRIFLVNISHRRIAIRGTVEWSSFTDAFNVEASAVANAGAGLVFIWAERNSGQQGTTIKWALSQYWQRVARSLAARVRSTSRFLRSWSIRRAIPCTRGRSSVWTWTARDRFTR